MMVIELKRNKREIKYTFDDHSLFKRLVDSSC